jgi:hypothetical protein
MMQETLTSETRKRRYGTEHHEGTDIRMKRWKDPECKIGINDPDTREQLHLKIERMSDGIDRKALGLEFVKRAPGTFSGLWKVTDLTARRDRRLPENENRDRTL